MPVPIGFFVDSAFRKPFLPDINSFKYAGWCLTGTCLQRTGWDFIFSFAPSVLVFVASAGTFL